MPIQWPKKFIGTGGTHRIGDHVQYVMINTSENTEIFLPPASVVGAPIHIMNRGTGLVTIRSVGGTIGGASLHKMYNFPAIVGGRLTEGRLVLMPGMSDSGVIDGNWTIIGGNVAHLVLGSAVSPTEVQPDTTTYLSVGYSFDAVDAVTGVDWSPKETDVYEAVASVVGGFMTEGTSLYVTLSRDSVGDGDLVYGQSFVTMNTNAASFTYYTRRIFTAGENYRFRARHNDTAGMKAIGGFFFSIRRVV